MDIGETGSGTLTTLVAGAVIGAAGLACGY